MPKMRYFFKLQKSPSARGSAPRLSFLILNCNYKFSQPSLPALSIQLL